MTPLGDPVAQKETADLIVSGGLVLTLDAEDRRIAAGAVAVREDRIAAVGPASEILARFSTPKVIDASGCVVLPGLVNAHTHAAMTLFRGLADDLPLMEWLTGHIFPAEARLTEHWVFWGTMLACAVSCPTWLASTRINRAFIACACASVRSRCASISSS